MGCNRSLVRVGPSAGQVQTGKGGKTVSCLQRARQNMGRRVIRFRQIKVGPAKINPDNIGCEDGGTGQSNEGCIDTKNELDPRLLNDQRFIKTAWGDVDPVQARIFIELQAQGIVSFNASASGAISFSVGDQTVNNGKCPPRRPPARLARLDDIPPMPHSNKAKDLEKKMKAAEDRRKKKQDALKERLRAHSRLGEHHHDVAAKAERSFKQKAAVKIAVKQAAFQERMDMQNEDRVERARAKSRAGEHAREFVKDADELVRFEAAEAIANNEERFEAHAQQQETERMDRIRAKSRMGERAKEVAEDLAKVCQERAAENMTRKQKIAETNNERRERFRTQRVLLNKRHRENICRALARRLAEKEDEAERDMDYEIETAQDSGEDDDDFFEPELKWLM